jgi:uncharacterized protein DUF1259
MKYSSLAMAILACILVLIPGGRLLSQDRPADDLPTTMPSAADTAALEKDFQEKTAVLGGIRLFEQSVLTIRLPRADLWVQNDMGEIPTAAGIESIFYFYRCPCGKDKVVGQLAVADFEVNDVLDALRKGQIDMVSLGAMFLGDKPRMMALRFQGEGDAAELAKTLKEALKRLETRN